jgi:hypothetical protein
MLCAITGAGKTSCYRLLAEALSLPADGGPHRKDTTTLSAHAPAADARLHASVSVAGTAAAEQHRGAAVQLSILNPQALGMAALYGELTPKLREWRDGLLPRVVRSTMVAKTKANAVEEVAGALLLQPQSPIQHWVVLDAPVDAAWAENLNSVLDDSQLLCLPSGERLHLAGLPLSLLLEAADLAAASPATVSRYLHTTMRSGWTSGTRVALHPYVHIEMGVINHGRSFYLATNIY